jgi:ParB family transcriptional regulator, chromosome partitioning protein
MANKRVLGKGLGAIITNSPSPAAEVEKKIIEATNSVIELEISKISPNPDQPRLHFDDEAIQGLAESIEASGLIQPIIVRRENDYHFIIAGERRYRACKSLGMKKIKAIIMEANEEENVSLAVIENVQRQNLDPIEEAKAYKLLITRFKLKQAEVAHKVGKDRTTIANLIRLLNLPENIQEAISAALISAGHAKILVSLNQKEQNHYFEQIISKSLSVRALEKLIADDNAAAVTKEISLKTSKDPHIKKMEDKLVSALGTKVEIRHSGEKGGKIEINYYSLDDFDRIIEKFV